MCDPKSLEEDKRKSLKKMDTPREKLKKQCKLETNLEEKKRQQEEW